MILIDTVSKSTVEERRCVYLGQQVYISINNSYVVVYTNSSRGEHGKEYFFTNNSGVVLISDNAERAEVWNRDGHQKDVPVKIFIWDKELPPCKLIDGVLCSVKSSKQPVLSELKVGDKISRENGNLYTVLHITPSDNIVITNDSNNEFFITNLTNYVKVTE